MVGTSKCLVDNYCEGEFMDFKKVITKDWDGNVGIYEIVAVVKRDDDRYSCVFKNSSGDLEKQLVYIEQLD